MATTSRRSVTAQSHGELLAAVIADTHLPRGRRRLPETCIERLGGADMILHAGDLSSVGALAELRGLGPPVVAVHGNADEPTLHELLPERVELTLAGVRIGLVHDAGRARKRLERLREQFPGCAAVVFGHSHIPLHEEQTDFQIFNPGSPTDRRRQPTRTMGMARIADGRVTFELIALGTGG